MSPISKGLHIKQEQFALFNHRLWRIDHQGNLYRSLKKISSGKIKPGWVSVASNVSGIASDGQSLYVSDQSGHVLERTRLGSWKKVELQAQHISGSRGGVCGLVAGKGVYCLQKVRGVISVTQPVKVAPEQKVVTALQWHYESGKEWYLSTQGVLYGRSDGMWAEKKSGVVKFVPVAGGLGNVVALLRDGGIFSTTSDVPLPENKISGLDVDLIGYDRQLGLIYQKGKEVFLTALLEKERIAKEKKRLEKNPKIAVPKVSAPKKVTPRIKEPDGRSFGLGANGTVPGLAKIPEPKKVVPQVKTVVVDSPLQGVPVLGRESAERQDQIVPGDLVPRDIVSGVQPKKWFDLKGKKEKATTQSKEQYLVSFKDIVLTERLLDSQSATDLSVGSDGSIFILTSDSKILRWSNSDRAFNLFPGTLSSISVNQGEVWGVNSLGKVVRHYKGDWDLIEDQSASSINVGIDGRVLITDSSNRVYQFDPKSEYFRRVTPMLSAKQAFSVSHDEIWLIRPTDQVYRCLKNRCQYMGKKAAELSLGMDGSVWIVGLDNKIYRYAEHDKRFEIFTRYQAKYIEVGPGGYPWTINTSDKVLRSKFFDRDESADMAVALQTKKSSEDGSVSYTATSYKLDSVPVFTSSATASVSENQTSAITLKATDTSTITYSLSGTDSSLFSVDSRTGVVTFSTAPDYESPSDSGADNVYNFTAVATDTDSNAVTQSVVVTVTDVVEAVTMTVGSIDYPTIVIGGQTWTSENMRHDAVNGNTWSYSNNTSNDADGYGRLYDWTAAMEGGTVEGSQGLCAVGWHVPTDADWKVLESALGMSTSQQDATRWRGTDEGTKLKVGGSSGFEAQLAGYYRTTHSVFNNRGTYTYLWSSTESGGGTYGRYMRNTEAKVYRGIHNQALGFSVRCLKD